MADTPKKILIVDLSKLEVSAIFTSAKAKKYLFESVKNGAECLKKIETFQPDLIIMNLFIPDIHALEILKQIKQKPDVKKIGVIIISDYAMVQDYNASIAEGANNFILRPFKTAEIFTSIERYFSGNLTPTPFNSPVKPKKREKKSQQETKEPATYIKFWGTRGSTAVAGPQYVRFGGNSACLEIRDKKNLVIVDAGTGIRNLNNTIDKSCKKITIILGHTHLDHIVGFPFFMPLYDPSFHITVWSPIGFEKSAKELFTGVMAYTLFPVRLDDIQAKLSFKTIQPNEPLTFGAIKIFSHYSCHPGPTLCFKIQIGKTLFGYVTDNEMLTGYLGHPNNITKDDERLIPYQSLISFLEGCDFIIHEAQYAPLEYIGKIGWGHSSTSNASVLIKQLGVKKWYVTHHDPAHTDEDLFQKHLFHQKLLEECAIDCQLLMAYDGLELPIE